MLEKYPGSKTRAARHGTERQHERDVYEQVMKAKLREIDRAKEDTREKVQSNLPQNVL